ncbi:hypothetical protein PAXRUDRAFT_158766, partial [Paxillus rubicundulus Ve08.2h10]
GERHMELSWYVELTSRQMSMNDDKIEEDETKPRRDPVGMMDGDDRHPNIPTELPDEEGAQGGNGELMVELLGVYPC